MSLAQYQNRFVQEGYLSCHRWNIFVSAMVFETLSDGYSPAIVER